MLISLFSCKKSENICKSSEEYKLTYKTKNQTIKNINLEQNEDLFIFNENKNKTKENVYLDEIKNQIVMDQEENDITPPEFEGLLSAKPVSDSQIILSWNPAIDNKTDTNEIRYQIYVSEHFGSYDLYVPYDEVQNSLSYIVSNLKKNKQYYFMVRAKDTAGNIDNNKTEHTSAVQTDFLPPSFEGLKSITAIYGDDSKVILRWKPALDDSCDSSEIQYEIYVSSFINSQNYNNPYIITSKNLPIEENSIYYIVEDLKSNTEYYFVVRAKDKYENIDSNKIELSFTTQDFSAPEFTGVKIVAPVENDESKLNVFWENAVDDNTKTNEIKYEISVSTMAGEHNFVIPYASITGHTFIQLEELFSNTQYYVAVRAVDSMGNASEYISELPAVTSDKTVPNFLGLESISNEDYNALTLEWIPASDNATDPMNIVYEIYQSTSSKMYDFYNPSYEVKGINSFNITGLNPATTYYFIVRAKDLLGNIELNEVEKSASTLFIESPIFNGIQSAVSVDHDKILLTWETALDNNTNSSDMVYEIYVSEKADYQKSDKPTAITEKGALNYVLYDLKPDTEYSIAVKAKDINSNKSLNIKNISQKTMPKIDIMPPEFEGIQELNYIDEKSLELRWKEAVDSYTPSQNMIYEIFISTMPDNYNFNTPDYVVSEGNLSYTITNLKENTIYYFTVKAKDLAGNLDTNRVELSNTSLINVKLKFEDDNAAFQDYNVNLNILGSENIISTLSFDSLFKKSVVSGYYSITCDHISGYIFSGNIYETLINPGDSLNVTCDYTSKMFSDSFDTFNEAWQIYDYENQTPDLTYIIDNTCGQNGTSSCLKLNINSTSYDTGLIQSLNNISASYISFYYKPVLYESDAIFEAGIDDSTALRIICPALGNETQNIYVNQYPEYDGIDTGIACVPNYFYLIELANIDFFNFTFDLYINQMYIDNYTFLNPVNSFNFIKLRAASTVGTVYFDELYILTP
ncbi:MAG: fibronectin type III domain-containing protein [Spirochaetia bacterium]|nr:fibronectin type III domain-containing protein [Spirochaetia bacterium]